MSTENQQPSGTTLDSLADLIKNNNAQTNERIDQLAKDLYNSKKTQESVAPQEVRYEPQPKPQIFNPVPPQPEFFDPATLSIEDQQKLFSTELKEALTKFRSNLNSDRAATALDRTTNGFPNKFLCEIEDFYRSSSKDPMVKMVVEEMEKGNFKPLAELTANNQSLHVDYMIKNKKKLGLTDEDIKAFRRTACQKAIEDFHRF